MDVENRRFTRIPFKMWAQVKGPKADYITHEVLNLSMGGCLLPMATELTPGDKCALEFVFTLNEVDMPIFLDGEVVRSDKEKVAFKFLRVDLENLSRLRQILFLKSPNTRVLAQEMIENPNFLLWDYPETQGEA